MPEVTKVARIPEYTNCYRVDFKPRHKRAPKGAKGLKNSPLVKNYQVRQIKLSRPKD